MSATVKAALLASATWVAALLAHLGLLVAGALAADASRAVRGSTTMVVVLVATAVTFLGGSGLVLRACHRLGVAGVAKVALLGVYLAVSMLTCFALFLTTALVFNR